jgi:predicted  nucleic acid-binding Zn-ribbon protein
MTLLGKVFTGLVFLLSVIFFALAIAVNASHLNQRQRADAEKLRADTAENQVRQIRTQYENTKTQLSIEQAARRTTIASLQDQLTTANNERESAERDLRDLQSALTAANQTIAANANELEAKTGENDQLRQALVDARLDRDQLFQRLVAATDQNNRLQGNLQSLATRERKLADDYTKLKERMDILDIRPDTLVSAPPQVNGEVLAVDGSGLVEISLGRDDGLREGFTLEVHRGEQYLGRLIVRSVRDNKSVAQILQSYQRGYIRPGDRVDSKLY